MGVTSAEGGLAPFTLKRELVEKSEAACGDFRLHTLQRLGESTKRSLQESQSQQEATYQERMNLPKEGSAEPVS
jgi:hypothetical protein